MAVERHQKPWGYELWWARTGAYAGKILHINADASLSLQYHERKLETIYVLSGSVRLHLDGRASMLSQGEAVDIPPFTIHRLTAVDGDAEVLEVSTPELDDVVRLEDKYGRCISST